MKNLIEITDLSTEEIECLISTGKDMDSDHRACYFKQVKNGKYIRMALILKLLEIK